MKFPHFFLQVKDAVNDCREFLRFTTKGYIILAALQVLNIDSIDNIKLEDKTKDEQKEFLNYLSSEIVNQFICMDTFEFENAGFSQSGRENKEGQIPCGYPGCPKKFKVDGKCRARHQTHCLFKNFEEHLEPNEINQELEPPETAENDVEEENMDSKFNYSCSLLKDGLLDWCREDAAKENDGERLVRLWRFDMLRFSLNNHSKYRLLAFNLQAQLMAILTPRQAHQLKHNRSFNIHGGKGSNVPGDLGLEFLNMRAKDALSSLCGNMTSSSITRCGRSLQGLNDIIESYTKGLGQYFGKPSNSKPSLQKDIKSLVQHLQPEKLFDKLPKRRHRSFPNIQFNCLKKLNGRKLNEWLTTKKEDFARTQRLRSYRVL